MASLMEFGDVSYSYANGARSLVAIYGECDQMENARFREKIMGTTSSFKRSAGEHGMRSVQDCVQDIGSYVQTLETYIENCAREIVRTPDIDLKIALGTGIGMNAITAQSLRNRLKELGSDNTFHNECNTESAGQIGHIHGLEKAKSAFQAYCERSGIEDQPTAIILNQASYFIDRQLEALQNFPLKMMDIYGTTPEFPARPEGMTLVKFPFVGDLPVEQLFANLEEKKKMLHFLIMDIELNIMEVCSENIIKYPDMPVEFKYDMARQIWDESRHAQFLIQRYEELGGRLGDYPVSHIAWKADQKGQDLMEKLIIQQIIGEGNGMDAAQVTMRALRETGDTRTAELINFQNADEALHCGIGNKWVLRLLGDDEEAYKKKISKVSQKIGRYIPGSAPVDFAGREKAGFPASFLADIKNGMQRKPGLN